MFWSFFLLLLVIVLIASVPSYPYSRGWGYTPFGVLAVVLIFYLVLIWFGFVVLWYPWGTAAPVATG